MTDRLAMGAAESPQSEPMPGKLRDHPRSGVPLGRASLKGVSFFFAQTLASKVLNVFGQIALAWLLVPADFGEASLALSIAFFANSVQRAGLEEILVQRARHFNRWASAAFWMAIAIGSATALVLLGTAPLLAEFFNAPQLARLLYLVAITVCVRSLATVPAANLQSQLRFGALATLAFGQSVLAVALSVLLASGGFGAVSIILPLTLSEVVRTVGLWFLAMPELMFRLDLSRWKYMVGESLLLVVCGVLMAIPWHVDFVLLGRLYEDKTVVGTYFWARNLSTQTLQLLSLNVATVLLPSLARLQKDPERQLAGFKRAASMLMLVAAPACLLQAAIASPVIELLFGERWRPAVGLVQVFSVAWSLSVISHVAASMIKAQGRYRLLAVYSATAAVLFPVCVALGAFAGDAIGAAMGVLVFSWISGPTLVYLAIQTSGGTWRHVFEIFCRPMACSALAMGLALSALSVIPVPADHFGCVLRIVSTVLLALLGYVGLIRIFAPEAWAGLRDEVFLSRRRKPAV